MNGWCLYTEAPYLSDTNMVFLDTEVNKGKRFTESGILDIKSYPISTMV